MQKKKEEARSISSFKFKQKISYFLLYVFGLTIYGIGNSIFVNNELVRAGVSGSNISTLLFLGGIFIATGLIILVYLFYRFYRSNILKTKILKALINYLLLILAVGIILGILGKIIFDFTSKDYNWTKRCIWILTTFIQGEMKFIFIYYCLSIYKEKTFDWKSHRFIIMILGIFMLLSLTILLSLYLPTIGGFFIFISDLVIATVIVYVELFQTKKGIENGG